MTTPISREEFLAHATPIQEDVKEIVQLLRAQGGQVASLDKRLAVLEDRQPARTAIQWGSAAGAFVAIVATLFDRLF